MHNGLTGESYKEGIRHIERWWKRVGVCFSLCNEWENQCQASLWNQEHIKPFKMFVTILRKWNDK